MTGSDAHTTPRAIILGLADTGLGAIRLLGRAGIDCWAVYDRTDDPALQSRYCSRAVQVSSDEEAVRTIETMARDSGDRPVLIPASDRFVGLLSAHRAQLGPVARFLLAPTEVVEALQDKNLFSKRVNAVGLRAPRSTEVVTGEQVRIAARELGLPIIAKPAMAAHKASAAFPKTVIASTPSELDHLAAAADASGAPLAVQEYIPGDTDAHISVAVCVAPGGHVVAQFCARKLRASGDGDGVGTYVTRVEDADAEAHAIELLRALEFVGVAEVELKRHADTGEFVAIEINARLWTQVILPARCGLNYPLMQYRLAIGEDPAAPEPRPGGGRWQDGWEDFYTTFRGGGYRSRGLVSFWEWLTQSMRADAHAYLALDDPGPTAKRGLDVAKRMARLPWRRLARRGPPPPPRS